MLVVDETGIWVTDGAGSRLSHFDPATGSVLSSIDISFPLSIASGFGSIWVMTVDREADDGPYALVRINPATSEIVSRLSLASVESSVEPWFVATGAGSVWVSDWSSSTIIRVAPTTNTIVATIDSGLGTGHAILALPSGVWVSSVFSSGVVRIDPTTDQAGQIISKENGHGAGLTELDGTIWASQDTRVVRIEPAP
jgi:streptogramin lyase